VSCDILVTPTRPAGKKAVVDTKAITRRQAVSSPDSLSRAKPDNEQSELMFVRATVTAAAIFTAAIGSASPVNSRPGGGDCYIAESGDCVKYPQHGGPQPPGATAQCAGIQQAAIKNPPRRRAQTLPDPPAWGRRQQKERVRRAGCIQAAMEEKS
jgi:hypothetical protein